ncbi:MAG: cupin domain-containing protein [Bacteroidetes bacterium]|nr:cupin domain-containing protein [Bacteroidota bacterium]MBL6943455.1 cupin domain-containing protein [Bacteroidales bacterium]
MDAHKIILKNEIEYQADTVVSKQLIKAKAGNITLFAFSEGEGLSEHTAPFDAFISILDGTAKVFIDKNEHVLEAGESIIMPKNIPHSLQAEKKFKMMLVMIRG